MCLFACCGISWLILKKAVVECHISLLGCCNIKPQTGWPKQQLLLTIRKLRVWNQLWLLSFTCRWPPSHCVLTWSFLSGCPWCLSLVRTPVTLDLGPTLRRHLTLITPFKAQSPDTVTFRIRATAQIWEFGRAQSCPEQVWRERSVLLIPGGRRPPDALSLPGSSRRVETGGVYTDWCLLMEFFLFF